MSNVTKVWTPVEDGWHDAQDAYAIYVWGDKVTFHDSNTGYEANWYFPDELRFCRATAAEATGVPSDEIMGIGTPYLDGFSERELERYAQLSPPEMFRLLLNREAELALRAKPDAQGGLDFPDSVGYWAFESTPGYQRHHVVEVTKYLPSLNSAYPYAAIQTHDNPWWIPRGTESWTGKWTRVYAPWERTTPVEAQPVQPESKET